MAGAPSKGSWTKYVEETSQTLFACWIKFLQDKYGGIRTMYGGYDAAYDAMLRAVVHMERATSSKMRFGRMYVGIDVWPVERGGVIGAEISLMLKLKRDDNGARVCDVRLEGNSLTIETDNLTVTRRYKYNVEEAYEAFLDLYCDREVMEDDSPMNMEIKDEWKVR